MSETCSICGDIPSLCVDPDDAGTYYLCHQCAVDNVLAGAEERSARQADVDALRTELDGLRAWKRSVDDALNSGDGAYRP